MGLVIEAPRFTAEDVAAFGERLQPEQTPLEGWSAAGPVPRGPRRGGFELEAWLVGPDLRPAPCPASRRPWSPVGGAVLASASDSPGSASCPRWRPSISLWPTGSHADVSGHATPHLPTPRRSRPLTFQIPGYNRPFMKNGDVAVEATATTLPVHLEVDFDPETIERPGRYCPWHSPSFNACILVVPPGKECCLHRCYRTIRSAPRHHSGSIGRSGP